MYLVEFENQEIKKFDIALALFTNQSDELADNLIWQFVDNSQVDRAIVLSFLDEFDDFSHETGDIILMADNSLDELDNFLLSKEIDRAVFFVKDFKDGRTFSLIRYLRNKGFDKEIYVLGNYGLDQANYYIKSGATGFFIKEEQLETLLKTLEDLKSGHFGNSVNQLPIFQ